MNRMTRVSTDFKESGNLTHSLRDVQLEIKLELDCHFVTT
jgi:hypothetical protein